MVRKQNQRSTLPRSKRRGLARRRAILVAAARAFRARGFAATGMRDIAEAADLSPANLYYYFRSKQDLLYFCQDHSLDRMLSAARSALRSHAPTPRRLADVIRAHLGCTLDELDGAAAHLEIDALPARLRVRVVRKRDRYEAAVRELIVDGIRLGELAPCDAAMVTRAILGALNWTARWYRPEGDVSPARLAESYSRYLVEGLLKRTRREDR
jgi:AcrR family transcriptional regulator